MFVSLTGSDACLVSYQTSSNRLLSACPVHKLDLVGQLHGSTGLYYADPSYLLSSRTLPQGHYADVLSSTSRVEQFPDSVVTIRSASPRTRRLGSHFLLWLMRVTPDLPSWLSSWVPLVWVQACAEAIACDIYVSLFLS